MYVTFSLNVFSLPKRSLDTTLWIVTSSAPLSRNYPSEWPLRYRPHRLPSLMKRLIIPWRAILCPLRISKHETTSACVLTSFKLSLLIDWNDPLCPILLQTSFCSVQPFEPPSPCLGPCSLFSWTVLAISLRATCFSPSQSRLFIRPKAVIADEDESSRKWVRWS